MGSGQLYDKLHGYQTFDKENTRTTAPSLAACSRNADVKTEIRSHKKFSTVFRIKTLELGNLF